MRLYFIYYDSPLLYVRKRSFGSEPEKIKIHKEKSHWDEKKKIRNFHKIYVFACAVIGIGNKAQKIFEKIRFSFDFCACKDLLGLDVWGWKIKISFIHAPASYDMNDKTSIFLCCLFLSASYVVSLEKYIRIKNSFAKCDRVLMEFLLVNHRMEIEFYVWWRWAFTSFFLPCDYLGARWKSLCW